MKKIFKTTCLIICFILLGVASLGIIFMPQSSKVSAENQPTVTTNPIFSYISISTAGYKYSSIDIENNTLYINSSITVTNIIPSTTITVAYGSTTHTLSSADHFTITYNSGEKKNLTIYGYGLPVTIVHTKINFKNTNVATWNGLTSPTLNSTYSAMNITFQNNVASSDSPLYINMNYNGQIYNLTYDGTNFSSNGSIIEGLSQLNLTASGPYTVEIYDNSLIEIIDSLDNITRLGNYLKYSFNVKSSDATKQAFDAGLSSFYMTLTDSSNEFLSTGSYKNESSKTITSYEYSNEAVQLKLHNLNYNISTYMDGVVITKTFNDEMGHYNDKFFYSNDYLETNDYTINLTEHGDYIIELVRNYNQSNKDYTAIEVYTTKLYLFMDIQSSGETIDGVEYTSTGINQETDWTVYKEIKNKFLISEDVYIYGSHQSEATLTVVNAQASIEGIENNAATTDIVKLTINGVGVIKVDVTHNGNSQPQSTTTNGKQLEFKEAGTYYVKITDAMGNVVTRSFKINTKMNAAALALIIIGSILVVVLFLFIIITRRKVKVK